MCRWLAYTGSPVLLARVLYTPVHSLIDQSLHSRLGAETTNGDGFGVGWYDAEPAPGLFRSTEPAWNDRNLRELAGHISSRLFFAHIRAAIGSAVQQTNCHPFRHGRWLFMHNGFIDGFAAVKRDLVMAVDAVAVLFGVRPETISKRIRDIRQLLEQAGHTIQPAQRRLSSLDDLYQLAATQGIAIPAETKTAC
jgi:predicted glutamine amidotransferase